MIIVLSVSVAVLYLTGAFLAWVLAEIEDDQDFRYYLDQWAKVVFWPLFTWYAVAEWAIERRS